MNTRKMVLCALFSAITFVATMLIQIKLTANGFVNLGDCMVIVGGIFLGPACGAFSGAIGSFLADAVSGYVLYIPATLIIKAFMAFVSYSAYIKISRINEFAGIVLSAAVAELIMIFGYFLYECIIFGTGAAIAGMPGNFLQAGLGLVCSVVLYYALSGNKYIKKQLINKKTIDK